LAGLFFLPLAAGVLRETLGVPLDPLVAACVLLALLTHLRAAAPR
jgi:hypothetical protein